MFINWTGTDPNEIGNALTAMTGLGLKLKMITNRGVKVYPNGLAENTVRIIGDADTLQLALKLLKASQFMMPYNLKLF